MDCRMAPVASVCGGERLLRGTGSLASVMDQVCAYSPVVSAKTRILQVQPMMVETGVRMPPVEQMEPQLQELMEIPVRTKMPNLP